MIKFFFIYLNIKSLRIIYAIVTRQLTDTAIRLQSSCQDGDSLARQFVCMNHVSAKCQAMSSVDKTAIR